jgi:hypothetical protein
VRGARGPSENLVNFLFIGFPGFRSGFLDESVCVVLEVRVVRGVRGVRAAIIVSSFWVWFKG